MTPIEWAGKQGTLAFGGSIAILGRGLQPNIVQVGLSAEEVSAMLLSIITPVYNEAERFPGVAGLNFAMREAAPQRGVVLESISAVILTGDRVVAFGIRA